MIKYLAIMCVGWLVLGPCGATGFEGFNRTSLLDATESIAIVQALSNEELHHASGRPAGEPYCITRVSVAELVGGATVPPVIDIVGPGPRQFEKRGLVAGRWYVVFLGRPTSSETRPLASRWGVMRVSPGEKELPFDEAWDNVLAVLRQSLVSEDAGLQQSILDTLVIVEDTPGALKPAQRLAKSNNDAVAASAMVYLLKSGASIDVAGPVQLIEKSTTLSDSERGRLADYAIYRNNSLSVSDLNSLAERGSPFVRTNAVQVLCVKGNRSSIPALVRALALGGNETRDAAHRALKRITERDVPDFREFRAQHQDVAEDWRAWLDAQDTVRRRSTADHSPPE